MSEDLNQIKAPFFVTDTQERKWFIARPVTNTELDKQKGTIYTAEGSNIEATSLGLFFLPLTYMAPGCFMSIAITTSSIMSAVLAALFMTIAITGSAWFFKNLQAHRKDHAIKRSSLPDLVYQWGAVDDKEPIDIICRLLAKRNLADQVERELARQTVLGERLYDRIVESICEAEIEYSVAQTETSDCALLQAVYSSHALTCVDDLQEEIRIHNSFMQLSNQPQNAALSCRQEYTPSIT